MSMHEDLMMLPPGLLDEFSDDEGNYEEMSQPRSPSETSTYEGEKEPREPHEFPSVGSVGHFKGICRPCAWEPKPGGCSKEKSCTFCHLCEEGEVKKRKKQRILALREMRARKKVVERSKVPLPPGPLPYTHPALRRVGQQVCEADAVVEKDVHDFTKESRGQKQESEDETESTAASSDKEAFINLQNSPTYSDINDSPFSPIKAEALPKEAQPVKLCRDPHGNLIMSPLLSGVTNINIESASIDHALPLSVTFLQLGL
jgi:hypothetical protein